MSYQRRRLTLHQCEFVLEDTDISVSIVLDLLEFGDQFFDLVAARPIQDLQLRELAPSWRTLCVKYENRI